METETTTLYRDDYTIGEGDKDVSIAIIIMETESKCQREREKKKRDKQQTAQKYDTPGVVFLFAFHSVQFSSVPFYNINTSLVMYINN